MLRSGRDEPNLFGCCLNGAQIPTKLRNQELPFSSQRHLGWRKLSISYEHKVSLPFYVLPPFYTRKIVFQEKTKQKKKNLL